jgi:CBS domain-containing protein
MEKKPTVVSDIMTREVVTVFEEDNLLGVEEGMQRFRFRHLPVVDGNKLVGIITHRDLLRIAASSLDTASAQKTNYWTEHCFARDIMVRDPVTVGRDTPLAVAGKLMWERKLGCLPVIEEDDTLVGIVTEADYLRLALELLA